MELLDEKKAKQERGSAYRDMVGTWAWRDFMNILNDIRASSLENAIISSNMENIQVERGKVQCIDTIKNEVDYILNEGQK
jgi:hypothetical protein